MGFNQGFTQNCNCKWRSCTNAFQQDRVDLKNHMLIIHGVWSNALYHFRAFRNGWSRERMGKLWIDDSVSKGIMMWVKWLNNTISWPWDIIYRVIFQEWIVQLTDLPRTDWWVTQKVMMRNAWCIKYQYERSKRIQCKTPSTALSRMSALGAVTLLVPGPKMTFWWTRNGYVDFFM
jgi:hypothetical protein